MFNTRVKKVKVVFIIWFRFFLNNYIILFRPKIVLRCCFLFTELIFFKFRINVRFIFYNGTALSFKIIIELKIGAMLELKMIE